MEYIHTYLHSSLPKLNLDWHLSIQKWQKRMDFEDTLIEIVIIYLISCLVMLTALMDAKLKQ